MRIDFNFSLETEKSPTEVTNLILKTLENFSGNVVSFSFNGAEENSFEEISGEVPEEISEDLSLRPAVNLDWKDKNILNDLHSLPAKEFSEKYDVSLNTFYYNKRKRKQSPVSGKYNATEYTLMIRNPDKFMETYGYESSSEAKLKKDARKYLTEYYNNKYPGIFDVAGQFSDRVVGSKYGVSTATVHLVRKVGGIVSYREFKRQ
jgi:hypothetical protein